MDKWDNFQNGSVIFFFSFFILILIFIYFFKYETIVRSSASSFGHSDPYPGSVGPSIYYVITKGGRVGPSINDVGNFSGF